MLRMFVVVVLFLGCAGNAGAADRAMARLIFEDAEAAYANNEYDVALRKLDEAEAMLGRINPPILHLRINIRSALLAESQGIYSFVVLHALRRDVSDFIANYSSEPGIEDDLRDVYRISKSLESYPVDSRRYVAAVTEGIHREIEAGRYVQLRQRLQQMEITYSGQANFWRDMQLKADAAWVASLQRLIPEVVVIPAGTYKMGHSIWDSGGAGPDDQRPKHKVTLESFALGKYEVTVAEYDAFVLDTGRARPGQPWGNGRRPVVNVTWQDATAYAEWLSARTGERWRLPTEAEWEYAARAGTTGNYPWAVQGDDCSSAHFKGHQGGCNRAPGTVTVGSYPANAFGLHDVIGNVYELVADCYNPNYEGAPTDGTAWLASADSCARRVARGWSWRDESFIWVSSRIPIRPDGKGDATGFRIAKDLR